MNLKQFLGCRASVLAVGVCLSCLGARGGNVIRLAHGGYTTDYATFAEGMGAASDGDTLTLLDNIDAAPMFGMTINKSVTIDLGGFKIANENPDVVYSRNMLFINDCKQVVIKNGTLHSRWQSVIVPNSTGSSVKLEDCVVSGGTMTWSGSTDVSITIGKGCAVTSSTLICGGNGNKVVVEGGEVYSDTLCSGGTLVVQGGCFAKDPSAYVQGMYQVRSESRTTQYGTTSYVVESVADHAATVTRNGTGAVESFASCAAAFGAAAAGDKITLLKDWLNPGKPFQITKAVTVDLNGHAISNDFNSNLLDVRATPVVFMNGTLSTLGQSSVVFNNGVQKAYMTNCVVAGATCAYSASMAELHVGAGCRFTCNAIASGYYTGSGGSSRVNVFLEDDDIVCAANKLYDTDGIKWSHVYVRGGVYKVDPSACVVGDRKAIAESSVTSYGTCGYKVVDRTGEETVVAGAVFPNGEIVKAATVEDAASYAQQDDTVRFFADVQTSGSYAMGKRLVYDLNGHSFANGANANFVWANADGCKIMNGTVESQYQSVFLPNKDVTLYVTDCTVKGGNAVYSGYENSRVVFTGCRIETTGVFSTHSTCKVAVEIADSSCSNASWPDNLSWLASSSASLAIRSCRSVISPVGFTDDTAYVAPLAQTSEGKTYQYVAFQAEDAPKYDLSSFTAIGGRVYCTTFAAAYDEVPDCGVLKMLKDIDIDTSFGFRKSLTIDMGGHVLRQTGTSANFLYLWDGHIVTITGGGTIDKLPAGNSTFWIDGNGGAFELVSCRVTGSTFAYGTSGEVRITSDDVTVESAALVSSHSTCKLTVRVDAGWLPDNIWDSGVPSLANGGYVRALGGTWQQDPFALAALSSAFTVGDGLVSRCSPIDQTYRLVAFPEAFDVDLSDASYVACSYTGSVPEEGAAITVNLSVAGIWNNRRKLLGDFSKLANADALTFVLGSVPTGYDVPFKLSYRDGLLYAGLDRGTWLVVR